MAGTYQTSRYYVGMTSALEAWGHQLDAILSGEEREAKIIPLR